MKIRVFQEGANMLFDAAGIKRKKQADNTGSGKKEKKKKKKKKPQEVLTGERWTTIFTGEEVRKLFVELGRMSELQDPTKVARSLIDMLVLVRLFLTFGLHVQ
jgi:ribosomal protein S4